MARREKSQCLYKKSKPTTAVFWLRVQPLLGYTEFGVVAKNRVTRFSNTHVVVYSLNESQIFGNPKHP